MLLVFDIQADLHKKKVAAKPAVSVSGHSVELVLHIVAATLFEKKFRYQGGSDFHHKEQFMFQLGQIEFEIFLIWPNLYVAF